MPSIALAKRFRQDRDYQRKQSKIVSRGTRWRGRFGRSEILNFEIP